MDFFFFGGVGGSVAICQCIPLRYLHTCICKYKPCVQSADSCAVVFVNVKQAVLNSELHYAQLHHPFISALRGSGINTLLWHCSVLAFGGRLAAKQLSLTNKLLYKVLESKHFFCVKLVLRGH